MAGPLNWGRKDWAGFEEHAAIQAIDAHRNDLARWIQTAQRALSRLDDLHDLRLGQMDRGEWPPPPKHWTPHSNLPGAEPNCPGCKYEADRTNRGETS